MKSDGNPFFVLEILRALRQSRQVRRRADGTWVRTGDTCRLSIPDSVKDLVQARISTLDEEDRDLLDMAACAGFEFDPLLVAEALERGRIPALKRFTHVQRAHRLVHAAGRTFIFDHHQVQEALYESLSEPLREEYHVALADALERRVGAEGEATPGGTAVEICDHLLKARRGERALGHFDAAMKHLEDGYLHARAADMAERALAIDGMFEGGARAELLLGRATLLNLLGRLADQRVAAEEAREVAVSLGDPRLEMRALALLGPSLVPDGSRPETREVLRRALRLSRTEGDRVSEARAHGFLASRHARAGRLYAAVRRFRCQLAVAREAGDGNQVAAAEGNLAHQYWRQGRHEESFEWATRCLANQRRLGDRLGESRTACLLGGWYYNFGRYQAAREQYERQLEISRDIGYRRGELIATSNIGLILRCTGRLAEAAARFKEDIEICRQMGNPLEAGVSRTYLAAVFAATGAFEESHEQWEQAIAVFRETGDRWWEAYALLFHGRLFADEGRFGEAESRYRQAIEMIEKQENRTALLDGHLFLGRLQLETGREEEARESLRAAADLGEEMGLPCGTLLAASLLARLPGEDPGRAMELLVRHEQSTDVLERMETRFALFRALGDRVHLEEAHRLLTEVRVHSPPESRTTMLERVPLYRDILEAWASRRD
jgi:tetratricopeptide (TPR) repeat protein